MIKEGKFGLSEAIILLILSNIARIFLPYPRLLAELGGPAAWMTPLGGLAVALAGVYLMTAVLKKSPDKTIIEISEDAFGPVVGIAVNLVVISFFLSVSMLFTREFSEALILSTLPYTPISVITTTYLSVGILGAYLGIEAMARAARLTAPYIFGGIVILLISLSPQWSLDNLFPFFGTGPVQVFGQGAFSTAALTEIILAAVLVQAMGGPDNIGKIGYRSMLIAFLLLSGLLAATVLTLGREYTTESTLPFYTVTRNIFLGRFFQRVEAVFVIIWSIIGGLKIALTLYGASVSLARTLKLPDYRPLIWPLGLVIFILSLLPPDMSTAVKLDADFLRPLSLVPNYLLPLLIIAAYWLRRRVGRADG
ncbi:GerAB/ArcD/ProY family transporter [Pelotomaculum propionicicum]